MMMQVDPAMQALLDSLPTRTMPFALVELPIPNMTPPQSQQMVVCAEHKLPVCAECNVNFTPLNYMQQFMRTAPPEAIPPPPNVQPPPQRAEQIKQVKERGNVR
jgi:translocation protein SEC72